MVLSSDEPAFGGYSNVTKESDAVLKTDEGTYDNRPHSFQVRSGLPRRMSCQEPTAIACEGEELVLHSSASYQQAQRKLSIVSFGMASPASKHANGLKWGCTCYVRVPHGRLPKSDGRCGAIVRFAGVRAVQDGCGVRASRVCGLPRRSEAHGCARARSQGRRPLLRRLRRWHVAHSQPHSSQRYLISCLRWLEPQALRSVTLCACPPHVVTLSRVCFSYRPDGCVTKLCDAAFATQFGLCRHLIKQHSIGLPMACGLALASATCVNRESIMHVSRGFASSLRHWLLRLLVG